MRYVTPDLEGNTIAYKGRRYWLIELAEDGMFQCVDTSVADYVVFAAVRWALRWVLSIMILSGFGPSEARL